LFTADEKEVNRKENIQLQKTPIMAISTKVPKLRTDWLGFVYLLKIFGKKHAMERKAVII
jgi:hypothetical protein